MAEPCSRLSIRLSNVIIIIIIYIIKLVKHHIIIKNIFMFNNIVRTIG